MRSIDPSDPQKADRTPSNGDFEQKRGKTAFTAPFRSPILYKICILYKRGSVRLGSYVHAPLCSLLAFAGGGWYFCFFILRPFDTFSALPRRRADVAPACF